MPPLVLMMSTSIAVTHRFHKPRETFFGADVGHLHAREFVASVKICGRGCLVCVNKMLRFEIVKEQRQRGIPEKQSELDFALTQLLRTFGHQTRQPHLVSSDCSHPKPVDS